MRHGGIWRQAVAFYLHVGNFTSMALTDTKLRSLKPVEKAYKVFDGDGLLIVVSPKGRLTWRFSYRHDGKRKEMTGPTYPALSLSEARKWRDDAKALLAKGLDPAEEKQRAKKVRRTEEAEGVRFEAVGRAWFARRATVWKDHYARITLARLEKDVFPEIGKRPIAGLEATDILAVIRKIEARQSVDLAHRIHAHIVAIFDSAVATGAAPRNPARDIAAALTPRPPVKHRAKLKASEIMPFFADLERSNSNQIIKDALIFAFYTLARTQETLLASWEEFENLEGSEPLWRIPPGRMKMRSEHLVPLAPTPVALLRELRAEFPKSRYVFPGMKDETLNLESMRMTMNRMGYKGRASPHGLRGTASTILNESGLFNKDWIELALAHQERDGVRAAYNSAQYLKQRREMLEWWALYLDNRRAEAALL